MSHVRSENATGRRKNAVLHVSHQKLNASEPVEVVKHALYMDQPLPQARHQQIAEAAYRLAEARGFAPGHEMDDWLTAEQEVDARQQATTE